jgi:hypothetical protein
MANDLISRKALITDLRTAKGLGSIIAETIVRFLKKQPTVDAVEVVRCKDCKYYENKNINLLPHCTLCGITKFEDDFCSCGERKDNDG